MFDRLSDGFNSALRHLSGKGRISDANIKEAVGTETVVGELPEWASETRNKFTEAMDDDMNISGAMAAIFDMVHAGNKAVTETPISGNQALAVCALWMEFDTVLGILELPVEEVSTEVTTLLEARSIARTEKNWAESDRIRDALTELGWTVKDTPEGPKLRKL